MKKTKKQPIIAEKNQNVLLLRIPPDRYIFTETQNYKFLIEFCKNFGAELSIIRLDQTLELTPLNEIPKKVCDPDLKLPLVTYNIVETKINNRKPRFKIKLATSEIPNNSVKEQIKEMILTGNSISLKDICLKFEAHGLSYSTLCNYFKQTRNQLITEGYGFIKIKQGHYQIQDKPKSYKNLDLHEMTDEQDISAYWNYKKPLI